jgi:hypothetical protein
MPRASWLLNRLRTQPALEFFTESIGGQAMQMEAFARATSIDDLFWRLEASGIVLRIDPGVRPGMMHYATISTSELALLRQIRTVIRKGHVKSIEADGLYFDTGRVPVGPRALYIDCTAPAVAKRPAMPIFQGDRIVLQLVRAPQPAFSAALVAYVEAHYDNDEHKNGLCATVPLSDTVEEFPRTALANLINESRWRKDSALRDWIIRSRLDGFGKVVAAVSRDDIEKQASSRKYVRMPGQRLPTCRNLLRSIPAGLDQSPLLGACRAYAARASKRARIFKTAARYSH